MATAAVANSAASAARLLEQAHAALTAVAREETAPAGARGDRGERLAEAWAALEAARLSVRVAQRAHAASRPPSATPVGPGAA